MHFKKILSKLFKKFEKILHLVSNKREDFF